MLLNEMEIFYYVGTLKSFSKTAETLHVSKSFISKKIQKLEKTLRTKLIHRSTRQLNLTEEGERLYVYCTSIVNESNKALNEMQIISNQPMGILKISAPPIYGAYLLPSVLVDYRERYPNMKVEVTLQTEHPNIIQKGYDLAISPGPFESSSLIAQRIHTVNSIICATPIFCRNHPLIIDNIHTYNWVVYSESSQLSNLQLKDGTIYHLNSHLITNSLTLIKSLILSHEYIGTLPIYMVTNELKQQTLLQCFSKYELPESQIYAVYPERNYMLPKLKLFLELIKNKIATLG